MNVKSLIHDFESKGLLKLSQVIHPSDLESLKTKFWQKINAQFDISLDRPSSWLANPNNPAGDYRAKRLTGMNPIMDALKNEGVFNQIEEQIQKNVDQHFGKNHWSIYTRWYSLLSFPGTEEQWNIPHRSWHIDEPIIEDQKYPFGLFAFLFLDEVKPMSGATTIVSGSQNFGKELLPKHSKTNNALLKAFPSIDQKLLNHNQETKLISLSEILKLIKEESKWFTELCSEGDPQQRIDFFMKETKVRDDISLEVMELTASAGDIILLDPRCLHSFSANTSSQPRQVLRVDLRRLK